MTTPRCRSRWGAPGAVLLCNSIMCCAGFAAFSGRPQVSPDKDKPLKSRRVDYETYGGFAGVLRQITVAGDGKMMVTTGDIFAAPVRFQAKPVEMARIIVALRGRYYPVGPTGADLLAALNPIQRRGLALASGSKVARIGSSPEPWTVEYSYSGGLAGISAHIAVNCDGSVTVGDPRDQSEQVRFAATIDDMARIVAELRKLNLSGPPQVMPPAKPMPDAIEESLSVTYGSQQCPIAPRGSTLPAVLHPIITRGMNLIMDAKWARAGSFRAGRTWTVQLEIRDARGYFHGEYWNAEWTRRGESETFDAVWHNTRTNEELHDIVILDSAERGHVSLHRPSQNQRLEGSYRPESPDRIFGNLAQSVSGCPGCPGPYWRATIKYQ